MASVSSLDKDLRRMRLEKYTPEAAQEVSTWIENEVGPLPAGDLLDGLKDGVVLCKLIRKSVNPQFKYLESQMPFKQRENIERFLRACESPPLNLPDHDRFMTVDLYERKDPAQVLQCLNAFKRVVEKQRGGGSVVSPTSTGRPATPNRTYGMSALSPSRTGGSGSGRWSPTKSPTSDRGASVSSWSKKGQEGVTSPAWNIAQYGYMGGASQGNLGIMYGARRQITNAGPQVPSLADKERQRKEQQAEAERLQLEAEENERRRQAEIEAGEKRAQLDEERRWEEETRYQRAEEKRKADEEKRRWEEEERQWRLTEEKRRKDEEEAEAKAAEERRRSRAAISPQRTGSGDPYADRVKQLEKELELARQREKEYEEERSRRLQRGAQARQQARSRSRPKLPDRGPSREESFVRGEREYLHTQWDRYEAQEPEAQIPTNLPPRPLPVPVPESKVEQTTTAAPPVTAHRTGESRPLPVPEQHTQSHAPAPAPRPLPTASPRPGGSPSPFGRPKRFGAPPTQSSVPPPVKPKPRNITPTAVPVAAPAPAPAPVVQQTYSRELDATAERDAEDERRMQSQAQTKAGGFASKSLLEREMEMERQRQQEWEQAQQETSQRVADAGGVDGIGGGIGGQWDVGQWAGYTGGDNQNKGGAGIGAGRRQIVGPRPLPGLPGRP